MSGVKVGASVFHPNSAAPSDFNPELWDGVDSTEVPQWDDGGKLSPGWACRLGPGTPPARLHLAGGVPVTHVRSSEKNPKTKTAKKTKRTF